jgi:hypothetical protein
MISWLQMVSWLNISATGYKIPRRTKMITIITAISGERMHISKVAAAIWAV